MTLPNCWGCCWVCDWKCSRSGIKLPSNPTSCSISESGDCDFGCDAVAAEGLETDMGVLLHRDAFMRIGGGRSFWQAAAAGLRLGAAAQSAVRSSTAG